MRRAEHKPSGRGDERGRAILEAALAVFREKGFERATMRQVADAAHVAVGAAYYYFPSKEALVFAWYEQIQERHAASFKPTGELQERIRLALVTKLDLLKEHRPLLSALFQFAAIKDHPLSPFSEGSRSVRASAMSVFEAAIGSEVSDALLKDLVVRSLWLAHLGLILFFIHDEGEAAKTYALAGRMADGFAKVCALLSLPFAGPFVAPILEALLEAELLSSPGIENPGVLTQTEKPR